MAVCAGITYDSVNNIILVEYTAGDGSKGLVGNPYTFQDIFDTDVANGWGKISVTTVGSSKLIYVAATLRLYGVTTWFSMYRDMLVLQDPTKTSIAEVFRIQCNITVQECSITIGPEIANSQRCIFKSIMYVSTHGISTSQTLNRLTVCLANTFTCQGSTVLTDCLLMRLSNHYYGGSSPYYPSINNMIIGGGAYGLIPQQDFVQANNITVSGANRGILCGYSPNFTIRNFKPINCTNDILVSGNLPNSFSTLIDCFVDLDTVTYTTTATGDKDATVYVKTTFSAVIDNSAGGTIVIKDKNNNAIYSETLLSDSMIPQEISYSILRHIVINSVNTNSRTDYYPFTLEVTKAGFDTLIIPNIYVTPGQPTVIRGVMVATAPTPPSISSLEITNPGVTDDDGIIVITAVFGTQPYEYSINGGEYQEEDTFMGLSEGTYSVSVRDANNSIDTIEGIKLKATVEIPRLTVLSIVHPSSDNNDGSIVVEAEGGVSPYMYSINSGEYQSEDTFAGLSEGEYLLGVRDGMLNESTLDGVRLKKNEIDDSRTEIVLSGTINNFESEILRHLLFNEDITNIGDDNGLIASSVDGNVYICLLKADPGEEGSIDNEADYTGYSRVAIERGDSGWIEGNGRAYNKEVISFPVCTGGANDIKWFGVCKTSTGDDMMWYGELSSTLYISAGVRPQYNIGQLAISIN